MNIFTTRKILSGLLLLIVGIIVTYIKGDVPEHLLSLMQSLYYAFVIGNATQHVSNAVVASKTGDTSQ